MDCVTNSYNLSLTVFASWKLESFTVWRATRKKGLSDVCVKCRFKLACAVRTGWSQTTFSFLCTFSVYSKSTLAQNLM